MIRYLFLAALVAAMLPSAVPTAVQAGETVYERHVAKGVAAIEQEQYHVAAAEFRAALTERPDDQTATLYLGTSLSRAGDPGAEMVLKKSLEMNRQDPRANLELGIYYYNKTSYPAARDYFERTIQLAPNSDLAVKAAGYLKATQQGGGRHWSAGIQTGIQYDSNVVLSGVDGLMPEGISHKSDWRTVLNLKARYRLVRQQGELWLGYSGYQSLHGRLHQFNVARQQVEAGAGYNLSPAVTLRASYAFGYYLVGGDDFNAAHTVSPSLTISEGKGVSTVLSVGYQKNHYMNSELFRQNDDRSGSVTRLGITQNISAGEMVEVSAGYFHAVESTRKDYWDYRGDQGTVDIRVTLPQRVALAFGAGYEKRDYKGIYPLTAKKRLDKASTASVTATKVLSEQVSVTLGQLYVRNKSNINDFDYKRAVSSLFLTVRF